MHLIGESLRDRCKDFSRFVAVIIMPIAIIEPTKKRSGLSVSKCFEPGGWQVFGVSMRAKEVGKQHNEWL
jgi:hypothetical protein